MNAPIIIRPGEASDHAFMLDSAWRSMRAHPATEDMAPAQIGNLLAPLLNSWQTLVAADPDHPQVIHAWLCFQDAQTVAWGYTKPDRRRKGAMRALVSAAGIQPKFDMPFPSTVYFARWRPRWRPYLVVK